jgi:phage terminase small subunit
MSLQAISDVRALPPSESPQHDSVAANRLVSDPPEHKIDTRRAKDASRGSGRPLTNGKYEHFAHLIAKGESPSKAYVLCGYSSNGALQSGNRLLRNPNVSARVQMLKAAVSERQVEKIAVDRAWVISMLIENVKRAMQVEPLRDREGNPIGQYSYQGGVANKALELLGKEIGMFQTTCEAPGSVSTAVTKARLNAGRQRLVDEKKAALEKGVPWP